MGLQINTNVAALTSYRNLTGTQGSMQNSLERLSSGLRINRAADDAAGLAISEKLRAQVGGLNQAQANAQDGVSLIQTAEGALNETHAMLQRMRTLTVQAASDTNTTDDRKAIQKEVDALANEINSTADRTEFNGMKLLNGDFKGKALQIGANTGQTLSVDIKAMTAKEIGLGDKVTVGAAAKPGTAGTIGGTNTNAITTLTVTGTAGKLKGGDYSISGSDVMLNGAKVGTFTDDTITMDSGGDMAGVKIQANKNLVSGFTFKATAGTPAPTDNHPSEIDVTTAAGAQAALDKIDSAIQKVSDQRADLGAIQNRLDHTIKNLGVSAENLAASESRIRDTDMAKEMTNFTRSQILQQAGTSMLAQANQSSQGVLKLLG